jgi:hypothetical protein
MVQNSPKAMLHPNIERAYGQRGRESDGHRELHRHAALGDILEGFLENGKAADDGAEHTSCPASLIASVSFNPANS